MKGPLYDIPAADKNTSPIKFSISLSSNLTVSAHLFDSSAVKVISF